MTLDEKKEALIETEWEDFQKVHNEGGRASCQDDRETFFIQRKCRLVTWPEALVESWHEDLKEANAAGRNLLSEKYAWMMRHTAPEEFKELRKYLQFPSMFTELKIEEVVKVQVAWMEEYKEKYPYMAAGNRAIHSSEDSPYETSFETYLRGELYTYSEKTVNLYLEMIHKLQEDGKNMSLIIMDATAKAYGYKDLQMAEDQQKIRAGRQGQ